MSDNQSFQKCSGNKTMTVATEAQHIVRQAAEPIPPGETIKGQLRRACRALGYVDGDWRVRAAWYGEAASWSAAALEDLRARYARWQIKKRSTGSQERMRAAEAFARIAEQLRGTDADFHGDTIAALLDLAGRIGGGTDEPSQ